MKRIVSSRYNSAKNNVRTVCEAMNWNTPTFCDKVKDGYKCKWGGHTYLEQAMREVVGNWDSVREICRNRLSDTESMKEYENLVESANQQIQKDLETILERTGIQCYINRYDNLVIPFYTENQ